MTVKLASLKTPDTESEWIDSIAFPGVRWHLKPLSEPAYQTDRAALLQRLRKQYGAQPVPQDVASTEFGKLYAKRLVLGWEGLDVAFSREVAMQTLSDPDYGEVVSDIETCASQVARINIEYVEETAKNFEAPSATS